jgi:hypothetical protein
VYTIFFFFFRHIYSEWSAEAVEKAVENRKERKRGHGGEATFNEGTNKPKNGRKDVTAPAVTHGSAT